MIVLFGFAWLFSFLAMFIYLIKGIWKKNRPLVKKKLLVSTIIMVVSFIGMMLTSTEPPEEPPQNPQVAKSVYRQDKTVETEAIKTKLKEINENNAQITGKPVEQKQTEQPEQSVTDAQKPVPAEPEKQHEAQPTPVETLPPADEPVLIATAPKPVPEPPTAQEETKSAAYIGNSNTKKVHRASCSSVDEIKPQHVVEYGDLDAAKNSGYAPCKRCKPF